jgi:hypothetical protein
MIERILRQKQVALQQAEAAYKELCAGKANSKGLARHGEYDTAFLAILCKLFVA